MCESRVVEKTGQEGKPKKARIASVIQVYSLECPYCGGEVASEHSGSLDFYSNESNGQTGSCTACGEKVRLPKAVRSGEEQ